MDSNSEILTSLRNSDVLSVTYKTLVEVIGKDQDSKYIRDIKQQIKLSMIESNLYAEKNTMGSSPGTLKEMTGLVFGFDCPGGT
jgi:hypothetical protein